jgi:metal-responsive CopG/Arc/MetJ family transcriptional regulator
LFGQKSFRLIGAYAELPVELGDEVDKIVEKKLLGYRSRAEFVAEAVRDKLIQVKR